jgi:NifB/MoaA-like Fe-S oxidoreductase
MPGVNDGKVLKKTLQDLYNLHPTVKTVAIVPVGLTRYHKIGKGAAAPAGDEANKAAGGKTSEAVDKERVRLMRSSEALQIFEMVSRFQAKAQKFFKYAFFYMSDEFYLMMNKELPRHAHYGYFEQIGNGVGLARKMITDFNRRKRYFPNSLDEKRNIWIITGVLGEKVLKPLVSEFGKIKKLKTRLITIKNDFFGHEVTVSGLLTGQDIKKQIECQLKKSVKPDTVIVPDVLLHDGKFLDDMTPEQIAEELGISITIVETSAIGLIEKTLGISRKNVPEGEEDGEEGPEIIYTDEPEEDEDYQDETEDYDEEENDNDTVEDDGEPEADLPGKDIEVTAKA